MAAGDPAGSIQLGYETVQATAPGLDEPAVVARLLINRAAKSNAFDPQTMREFVAAVEQTGARDDVRALVITGAGDRAFIGGADIATMGQLDAGTARAFITAVHYCCRAVRECPVPVIARINGVTFGAGLELAASCDLLVAADTARFGMPEVKLGIPSVVEAALLPDIVGRARAREMLLLGDTFSAEEALEWGLVHRVVAPAELDKVVDGWLASLLANGPRSVRTQKVLLNQWQQMPLDRAVEVSIDAFEASWQHDEPARMMSAWLEARSNANK